jgi:hypothetical protein
VFSQVARLHPFKQPPSGRLLPYDMLTVCI